MTEEKKGKSLAAFIKDAKTSEASAFLRGGAHKELLANLEKPGARLNRSGKQDQAQLDSVLKLGSVTRNKRAARKIARNKDTIKTLLGSITSRPRFSKLVEYSAECLKNLAIDEVSTEEMIDEGALEVLVDVMKKNPYNERIAAAVNNCIHAFAINDHLAKMIMDRIGGDSLIFSLRKHVEPETLTASCDAMSRLMTCKDNVDKLVDAGAIEALAHVAKSNPDHPEVVAAASRCCAQIAEYPEHAKRLLDSGVMNSIIEAMKKNPDDANLARAGAQLISNLAASGDQEIIDKLKEMGAVDMLVKTLEMFPEDEELAGLGAAALKLLSGAEDLQSAMDLIETGNLAAQSLAMGTIASLLLVDENVDYIVEKGGIAQLVKAITHASGLSGPQADYILEAGMRALMRCATNEKNIYKIMEAGGVKACVKLLASHFENEKVVAAALGFMAHLVTRKENADYIVACGGVEAALNALRAHSEDEVVTKHAVDLFSRLAVHEDALDHMVEKGALAELVNALKAHIDNGELVKSILTALGRCANSEESIRELCKTGAVQAIIDALEQHIDDPDLVLDALNLLETVALLPENLDLLRELGAMDSILKAMETHPSVAEIQSTASSVIARIAGEQQLKVTVENVEELVGRISSNPALSVPIVRSMAPAVQLLSNLAVIADNVAYLSQNGGVHALSTAFVVCSKLAPSDDRDVVLAAAAQGLFRLCNSNENREQIIQSGAFHGMVAMCLSSPDNEALAEQVMLLAQGLTDSPEIAAMMGTLETVDDIINLVKAHPLNEHILAAATRALANLCFSTEMGDMIANAGGGEVAVEAIYANMDNADVLAECLGAVAKLAITELSSKALVEAGAIEAILDALRSHPENGEVVESAIHALTALLKDPSSCAAIGEKGGLPLLLDALRNHYSDEAIIEGDIPLLEQLAKDANNKGILLDEDFGAIGLIEWAESTFEDNQVIQQSAAALLENLRNRVEADQMGAAVDIKQYSVDEINALLASLNADGVESAELIALLNEISGLSQDEDQCALLLENGVLQALTACMLDNRDDEAVFRAAGIAFQQLSAGDGDQVMKMLGEPKVIEALVEMVKPHSAFAHDLGDGVMTAALERLYRLANEGESVEQMIKDGAIQPLLDMLVKGGDPDAMIAAAKLLARLSNQDNAAELLAKLANLRQLIQAMRDHMDLPEFLKYAVYLLANLAVNDEIKQKIGIEGGVQVIIQILETHQDNHGVVENCCYGLGNLSYQCKVNMSFIVACQGIQQLIKSMANYPTEADLLESAVVALCNLCFRNDANKVQIVEEGGTQAIVAAMLDNVNQMDLLVASFRTLGNLALTPVNIPTIIKDGGVQAIVAAMTVHSQDTDVIDTAIRVLSNLASECDDEHMAIMAEEGAVQAIVDVALEHPDNLDIEVAAFGCLCNFARDHANSRMVVRQGGLEAVIASLAQLSFDEELSEKAVRLVSALTFNDKNVDSVISSGIVTSVLNAISEHSGCRNLLIGALQSFANIAFAKEYATKLAEMDVIKVIMGIIIGNMNDTSVLTESFQALSSLCCSEHNAVSMSESVMHALTTALRTHCTNPMFMNNALTFLSNLCVFPDAASSVTKTELCAAVMHGLNTQMTEPQVLIRGLRALENMAISTNPVKAHMKAQGVVDCMKGIESTYKTRSADVAAAARRVIDAINTMIRGLTEMKPVQRNMKIARDIFGDKRNQNDVVAELPTDVLNLLKGGALLTKHSNKAPPRPRHVYVTPELKYLCWKNPNRKLEDKQMMKTYLMKDVQKGRCTPQLQRRKKFPKSGYMADDTKCFAVFGRERTIDLEAKSEVERDQWVSALKKLIDYIKDKRRVDIKFA